MSTENGHSTPDVALDSLSNWKHVPTRRDEIKFVSEDRTQTVICTPVSTASGNAYNCVLYDQKNAYGKGRQKTSAIAISQETIPETIQSEFKK